ncbi:MAG: phage tail tape measure protein, partial [Synergistaceae bacterium]|nr:phage tail tape measure protein [Synergistaceae bacterium]MBR2209264.1 phage tail tape measure protein [Synergistaceae bacterium]
MADDNGVRIRITGDSSQAIRSVDDLMKALEKLRRERNSVAADAAKPMQFNLSELKLPQNLGKTFAQSFSQGLNQVSTSLNDLGTRLSTTFGGVFQTIKNGLLAIVGTSGLIGMQLKKSFAIGGGFESTMTSVQVVSGATAQEFEQLTAKAREMGATLPITAQQAGQAMLIMAQRGSDFGDILATVEDVSNLAISQGTDMATAAELLGSTMTQFSISTEEAGKVVDVFNNACNDSPINMTRLVDAMKYVGPVAGSMGIKLEEAVAALEALHASGLTGEMAGTGLRSILQKLAAKAQIAGVETKNLDGSLRSLSEIFGELQTKGYSVAQATKDFGARGANAALGLMKLSGSLEEYETKLKRVGATSNAVQEKMKSWPNVWNAFQSATEELHIEIFDQIKNKSKDIVSVFANLTRKLSEWVKETGIAQKILNSFLHGLGLALPSGDDFSKFLDKIDVNEILIVARKIGETVKNIGEGIVTFFENVKTPLLFLIKNLGTFATVSFWGWILGSGMKIAGILLSIASSIGGLAAKLGLLKAASAGVASTGLLAMLFNPVGLAIAGTAVAAGGAVYIAHSYRQSQREARKLEAEKKKAEAEMKRADQEVRATMDFKTGFEEMPEAYKKSSGELKSEIQEDIFYLQESFKDKIADVFSDINIEKIKEKFSGDNVKINFDN